jgi:hypothetical protein
MSGNDSVYLFGLIDGIALIVIVYFLIKYYK